jgi:hypothetical protein
MTNATEHRQEKPPRRKEARNEPVPTWRKTSPPGNQDVDRRDLERGLERLETVLGR